MVRLHAVIVWVVAGVAGCAAAAHAPKPALPTPTAQRTVARSDAQGLQCRMERPTGSLLSVQSCTTRAQREAIKAATEGIQQELRNTQGGACHSPECANQ